jgi:hypothetical protein
MNLQKHVRHFKNIHTIAVTCFVYNKLNFCYSIATNVRHIPVMTAPLVVLNNFTLPNPEQDPNLSAAVNLTKVTLQHMFPSINVTKIKLSECRRVVLFHYEREEGRYSIVFLSEHSILTLISF